MDDVLKLGRQTTYAYGEILLRPTDHGDTVYVVTSGMVHVYTIEQSGNKNVHVIYGPGDIFPSTWPIMRKPLNMFYEALTDCEVTKISQPRLEELAQTDVRVSYAMLKQNARQFLLFKACVDNLEYRYTRERVAYRLLLIGKKFGTLTANGVLMLRLSQDELANSTNVSRESVNRELRRFERLGHISYGPNKQMTIDPSALRKELAPADSPLLIDDI